MLGYRRTHANTVGYALIKAGGLTKKLSEQIFSKHVGPPLKLKLEYRVQYLSMESLVIFETAEPYQVTGENYRALRYTVWYSIDTVKCREKLLPWDSITVLESFEFQS